MNMSSIGAGLGLTKTTLDSYINYLVALFVFDKVLPYLKTDYERVGRKAKIYSTDTGLMCSILNWKIDEVMLDMDRSGKLMETFVYNELSSQLSLNSNYSMTQFRDREKYEIDFIIESGAEEILGIEVKASHGVSRSDFLPQEWFCKNVLKGKRQYTGLILYSGDRVTQFAENMFTVPIAAVWMK